MNTVEKIKILGSGSKFDACSCTPAMRAEHGTKHIGDTLGCAITRSATPDGKPISLFKVLYSNVCSFDCTYCPNRTGCSKQKTTFEDTELAAAFMKLYIQNYVEGLFLSSGVMKDPDTTMEQMLRSVTLLRETYQYRGYIHLKIMPGTNRDLVKQAGELADRLSINVEAPSQDRLTDLSTIKNLKIDVIRRQRWMDSQHIRSGHSTQFVVGGAGESDWEILRMAHWEYKNVGLQKAYYSAFKPVESTPLAAKKHVPVTREVSLTRSDFLMRSYKYSLADIHGILDDDGMLPQGDPKFHIALNEFDRPVDLNDLSYEELLRIPGIGHISAMRILRLQKQHKIRSAKQLHTMGVVMKRARPFLKLNGHAQTALTRFAR
ncbi:MAG: hypothetical protein KKA90_00735 [Nanoarchaeota archaeon]|nr:hypothetical protein [Nanoarchaeota archaeon]